MATYTIREKLLNYYGFEIDDVLVLDNRRNDLTVDFTTDPSGYCHFKTSAGAAIFGYQNLLPYEFTIIDIDDNEFNPTTVEELKGYLEDIHFFDWQSNYGGGGSGGVDRFDELLDTFNYVGKQRHVPFVNDSMTGLISEYLYNYNRITQHQDFSPNTALTAAMVGKKLGIELVSGNVKITPVDDTVNVPIPPNQIIQFEVEIDGEEVTVAEDSAVRIDGIIYDNASALPIEVLYAAAGYHRYDIIYGRANDISGDVWEIAHGVEGLETEDIAEPTIPANTVRATKLLVTDSGITENPYPFGNPWISKESKGTINIFSTGVINNLERSNLTLYDFSQTAEVRGLETATTAPDYDPNYVNQKYTFKNSSAGSVTFKHLHASGEIKFFMPNAADFVLGAGYTAEFFYNKVTNTLDYIGNFASGGGGATPYSLKIEYAGTDITVPSGLSVDTIINLTDIEKDVTSSVTGTDLTITGGAYSGDILYIDGSY